MKKALKIFSLIALLMAVPAIASLGIVALWNGIVTTVCGFAAISFWQGVGLFMLFQLLGGGFLLMLFVLFGSMHAIGHKHGELDYHWHNMTDEQRREFIRSRRHRFGFHNHTSCKEDNAAER